MTTLQKQKLLCRMQEVEKRISELKKTREDVAAAGYQSATQSTSGGSKSYTKVTIAELTEAIQALTSELLQLRRALGGGGGGPWKTVLMVYD